MDADPGRVVNGALNGEVVIEGPNGLRVKGRNFSFSADAMRISCDSEVEFEYQNSYGTAEGCR